MSLELRWTEQAVNQLGTVAEHISLASPIYAEQVVERLVARLRQAQDFPASGRLVPEMNRVDLRELIEAPTASSIASIRPPSKSSRSCTGAKISRRTFRADYSRRTYNVRCC